MTAVKMLLICVSEDCRDWLRIAATTRYTAVICMLELLLNPSKPNKQLLHRDRKKTAPLNMSE